MTNLGSKRTKSGQYISKHGSILKCPICDSPLKVQAFKSITCSKKHTFDIAKQGYLNLMTHPVQTNYDRRLFEARKRVITGSNLFSPFHTEITRLIHKYKAINKNLSVIDMGSGEGSHLYTITNALQSEIKHSITRVGIDISKEGILEAAKNYVDHIWIVADLAKTPLANHTCDVMLNILSPSNYSEFNRILNDDGIVIKVVPRKNYLIELRQHFHRNSGKKDYSNEKVVNHFNKHFKLIDHTVVNYTKKLDHPALQSLLLMTPLTWGISADEIGNFLESHQGNITIDLDILIGMKMTK